MRTTPDSILNPLHERKQPMSDQPEERPEPQSFASFLVQHARGRSERELSERLRDLVEAVEDTGKPGSITYTVTIKPQPNAEHVVLVTDTVNTKYPTLDRPASIFFADSEHRLLRTDPRQTQFDFAEEPV